MDLSKAMRLRIKSLMDANKVNGNKLALSSGINRSTVNRFLKGKNKSITIESITLICQSQNITLKDFFDDEVFDDVEVND
ncbi:MAG: helix-turn-helix domain-containing protein [Clostridia bacterium]